MLTARARFLRFHAPALRALVAIGSVFAFAGPAPADDTDIYLNPSVASGAEPLVMFTLDYRSNLTSAACGGTECDDLITAGYLPAAGPYNFFQVLRGVLKRVLDPLSGVKIGFMMNHDDNCVGNPTAGPTKTPVGRGTRHTGDEPHEEDVTSITK